MHRLSSLAAAAALALAPGRAPAYEEVAVPDGGAVVGEVRFRGAPPPAASRPVDRDVETCGASVRDESLVVGSGGGLANAVVSLEGVARGRPVDRQARVRLDSSGCRFVPHVAALAAGQVLEVRNLDPIEHVVQASAADEEVAFRLALPIQNQVLLQKLKRPGLLHVTCANAHPWSSAYVVVKEHPYVAVTGEDGGFRLEGVPPGRYAWSLWHESLGTRRGEVEVRAGAETALPLAFGGR